MFRVFGENILAAKEAISAPKEVALQPDGSEAFLRISGMHCSSCEILITRCAEKIDGILSISTSYATSTAKVIYDPERIKESDLPDILSQSGYKACFHNDNISNTDEDKDLLFVVAAAGLAFGVMMLNVAFFYPTNLGLVTLEELKPVGWLAFYAAPRAMLMLTTLLIFIVGFPILRGAWIGIRARVLNMDNLLAIAILAAYAFSVGQLIIGELDLYFDVASVIVAVVTVGRYFERGAKAHATRELSNIIQAWAPVARVKRDGELINLTLAELKAGDHIVIRQGEPIPVDGKIISGTGAVDESLMTGEPFPVTREMGETVLGGTTVVEGDLDINVGDRVESQMDNLARILWSVQSSTTGAQSIADRIARIFVPSVLLLAFAVTGWMLLGDTQPSYALLAGLTTLIVSCPCTFGLAVPLTTATAISTALRHGIIVTSADLFEKAPEFSTVAIDKTGTLSAGKMEVVKVLGEPQLVEYAAAVEHLSTHPIAKAIATLDNQLKATDLTLHPGKGAEACVNEHRVAVGSRSLFVLLDWDIPQELSSQISTSMPAEEVVSYVGWDGSVYGAIITRDQQRPEWERVVKQLRQDHQVALLTGAEHPGGYEKQVDQFYAGVPPEAKAAIIRQLKIDGGVVMIGDGSNDAPALAAADLGIAFGVPTSLAAEAADVVIPGDRLERIFIAFELIKTTRLRIRQNIGWALLYNAIAIPLALTGQLNPLFAALAMASSSLLVVWNSSRAIDKSSWDSSPPEPIDTSPRNGQGYNLESSKIVHSNLR